MQLDPRTSYEVNHKLDLSAFTPVKSLRAKEMTSPVKGVGDSHFETCTHADFSVPELSVE
jgi:hypothetical protein